MTPICLLSKCNSLPDQFREIWPRKTHCMKKGMMYRGGIYFVFFPNIPEAKKPSGEYVITYKEVKEVLQFEDIGDGILKGYYESD